MDKLMFFSKSADKPPGKGVHEAVSNPEEYEKLAKVKHWRKMLSNFYESEFQLDGKRWLSVEHFYQGSKFKKTHPKFYAQFSLDSGTEISKDPCKAKRAGGKTGGGLRPKNIRMDMRFFKGKDKVFYRAMVAKFSQNPELRKVLLDTKDAQLLHKTRGTPLQRVFPLEAARKTISEMEELAKHFGEDFLSIQRCLKETARLRSLSEEEVLKVVIASVP